MSAAVRDDTSIKEAIETIVGSKRNKSKRNATTPESENYLLRIVIDGTHVFETTFTLFDDGTILNKCITLDCTNKCDSNISTNTPEKSCFTPTLSRANLPKGITPTDVLQTLSTKLKFAILNGKNEFTISDVARLPNPATGKPFITQLSKWRVLRGEPTLYEKYGYTAADLDSYRALVTSMPWSEIMDAVTPKGKTLQAIVDEYYPGIFRPERTIAECMKEVSLEDTEKYIEPYLVFDRKTIVGLIMNALEKKGIPSPKFHLTITRDSDLWKSWDARIHFISFAPITTMGGRRTRRTRLTRLTRRKRQTSRRI